MTTATPVSTAPPASAASAASAARSTSSAGTKTQPSELIELRGVTKIYNSGEVEVPVLRGVDLTIERGEHVAIMGRSGAGKSTLMNIIGCMDRPSAGSYRLDGQVLGELDDDGLSAIRGRTVGFVFQSFHLLRGLTVVENVELPMAYQHAPRAARRERAVALLERTGLGHRLEHRPHQLSGGERQRVAIARALVNLPSVLLADEPTGNLDSRARANVLQLFDELHRELGITLIIVTHDPEIGAAAKRLVEIADGRIV